MGIIAWIEQFSADMGAGQFGKENKTVSKKGGSKMSKNSLSKYLDTNYLDIYDYKNPIINIEKYLSSGSIVDVTRSKILTEDFWEYPDGTRHTTRRIEFSSRFSIRKG